MSTWLPLQAARHLVSALEPHCWELGVSQPVPPSPAGLGGGPWLGRKVGAARVNFAQSLGGVLVKDSPDVRGVSSLWMLECVGQCRRLRLKGCEVSLWRLLSDRLVVGCESWTLAFWLLSDLLHS